MTVELGFLGIGTHQLARRSTLLVVSLRLDRAAQWISGLVRDVLSEGVRSRSLILNYDDR